MRNIFLEKSYTKCGGETSPRPFSKKLKLMLSLDQYSKVLYSSFLLLKIFLLLYSSNWPKFIWLPLLCEILGNMRVAIVSKPGYDVMDFEVNLIVLLKPFFLNDQKVVTKTEIFWERKELLRWNKKHLLSLLKGFQ